MSDFALIPIGSRKGIVAFSKVDNEDASRISALRWHLQKGYAKRGPKQIGMHRDVVQNWNMSMDVDHINGDKLDNRKMNLRVVSRSINRQNTGKPKRKVATSSQFKGVGRKNNLWYVQLNVNWKKLCGGYYRNEVEAAHRYDELARLHYGPQAHVNFPQEVVS